MFVIAVARRVEVAIELLLLLGRQQAPNLIVSLEDKLVMLMVKILMELSPFWRANRAPAFRPGDVDPVSQLQVVSEPIDKTMSARRAAGVRLR